MLHRSVRYLPLSILVIASALRAADAPSSRPARTDLSDPRKTVQSFLHAVGSTDPAAIKSVIVATPEQESTTTTIINLWVAQAKLRQAAESKFGDQAAQYFGTVNSQIESRLKTLEAAPLKVSGDSAVLDVPADDTTHQPAGTVVLKKIDNAWKLDAGTLFNLSTTAPDVTAQRVALAAKLTAVSDTTAQDIAAGKFPSAGDAYQEFWTRSLAVLKPSSSTTQPK